MERKGLIDRKYEEAQYIFFSLSGFSQWVLKNADPDKVALVSLYDLYRDTPPGSSITPASWETSPF